MPEALVRGVHINYEIVGERGPFIALTPGSRRGYDELLDFSKMIAAAGYRVLLHDRRNCGASDVAFDGSASEHEVWATISTNSASNSARCRWWSAVRRRARGSQSCMQSGTRTVCAVFSCGA